MVAQSVTQSTQVIASSAGKARFLAVNRFGGFALALMLTLAVQGCKSNPSAQPAATFPGSASTAAAPIAPTEPAAADAPQASPSDYSTSPAGPTGAGTRGLSSPNSVQHVWLGDSAIGMPQALSIAMPAGWHVQGGIVRNVSCSPGDAFPQFVATSGDGSYSLTVMTPFFTTSMPTNFNLQGCGTVAQPTTAANVLTRYVMPAIRKGAQISAPEAAPGWDGFVKGAAAPSNGFSETRNASRVHVSYTQNGQAVEEYVVGTTSVIRHVGMNGGTSTTTVSIYKAPAGKLDDFYHQAMATIAITPALQWEQRNQQLAQQAAQQAEQQGQQQRAAILQQSQDAGAAGRAMLANTRNQIQATGQASMNAAAQSEAARHTGAVGTADYVGGRPTSTYFFCNSSGGRTTNNNPNPPGPGWYPCS